MFLVALVASPARAEMLALPEPPPPPPASTSMFALHLGIGRQPVPGDRRTVFTDGLELSDAFGPVRVAAEAGFAYAFGDQQHAIDTRAAGVFGSLAVRRRLGTAAIFYIDVEAGVGGILAHDSQLGRLERPDAFVGLRTGYDIEQNFEAVFDVHLIETPSGAGWMAGVGMGWGG